MAKLKPRARIIRTIGDKLISGPEAAIIELVKNSYDADSPSIEIKITPCDAHNGTILIKDRGHGMTYEKILGDWLEPATDTKTLNRKSQSGVRTVLGAKGVGRFAAASLGKKLTLTSIAEGENGLEKSTLDIDWSVFESNKYLDDIEIDIHRDIADSNSTTGVVLRITDLNNIWDSNKLEKLIRELKRLATPQHTPNSFEIFLDLDDFTEDSPKPYNFNGRELLKEKNRSLNHTVDENIDNLILPYSLNDESDYHLTGTFAADGSFTGTFTIDRGDKKPLSIKLPPPKLNSSELNCGPLEINFKIFDLEKDSIEKLFTRMGLNFSDFGLREARRLLAENTGIAIYRSGFRIRPYGEPDNDWLQLEKRRVQDPSRKIGHTQIAGSIHVGTEEESHLIERSSREGLENNGSFERLTNLITSVLVVIEAKRLEFRTKAGISRKPAKNIGKARDIASLEAITKAVQSLSPEEQRPILLKIEQESKALTKTLDEIEAYQKLLESRAALGMVVAQVIHDGRTYLEPINSSASSLINNASFLLEESKKGELVRKYYPTYGEAIQSGAKGLSSLFKSLDPISGRRTGKRVEFNLYETIRNCSNLLSEASIEADVEISIEIPNDITVFGWESDLQSSLINILQNAIYWLSTIDKPDKKITIKSRITDEFARIFISNNGPLIDESDVENIFEAGFTLKSDGHGLGLSIAREAIRHSKGELLYLDHEDETTFVIEFPLSKDET